MELSPVTIYVTKKTRGLQIKGKINVGVQPVLYVPANFPVSLSPCLWPHQFLVLICLCVWFVLGTRCDTPVQGTLTYTVLQQWCRSSECWNTGQMLKWESWQPGNCYAKFMKHVGSIAAAERVNRWKIMFVFFLKLLYSFVWNFLTRWCEHDIQQEKKNLSE